MDRKVYLKDGNVIKINNDSGRIVIDKGYIENGEPSKILTMSMQDDFGFEAYSFLEDDTNQVDFNIPDYDMLYKHLSTLLGENDNLVIDDDMACEEKQKYVKIQRQEKNILISFYNVLEDESITSKFIITVINIMKDGRSRVDINGLDTKERLVKFFRGVEKENMELTSWRNSPNGKITESDVVSAKNYLSKEEIEGLEL